MERLKEFLNWNMENPHNVNFKMIVVKEGRVQSEAQENAKGDQTGQRETLQRTLGGKRGYKGAEKI